MAISFSLELAWSQVSLFDANLDDPFNDWNEQHLAQGFSWRPGSVSFKTPLRHGEIDIALDLIDAMVLAPDASRAIVVPFTSWGGLIEISTISGSEVVDIPPGRYALLFQTGIRGGRSWCSFGLLDAPYMSVEPVILRGDEDLDPHVELLMEAQPAA
jgi:Competence protein J (ComJ)